MDDNHAVPFRCERRTGSQTSSGNSGKQRVDFQCGRGGKKRGGENCPSTAACCSYLGIPLMQPDQPRCCSWSGQKLPLTSAEGSKVGGMCWYAALPLDGLNDRKSGEQLQFSYI